MVSKVYISAMAGNVGTFMAGTALTWSSSVVPKLTSSSLDDNPFGSQITSDESSWISSLTPLGATFGPFLFGYAADKFGRKLTLLSLAIPFLVSYLILAFAETVALYYVSRILMGFGVGGIFTVIPMYVGEIAENSNRGTLGTVMNCFLAFGLLFAYSLGPYIKIMWFNVILAIIPLVFLSLFFIFSPESPYYYMAKGRESDAEKSLIRLRSVSDDAIMKELSEIKETIEKTRGGSVMDLFKSKGLIKALIIALGLMFFQQFAGINAVLFNAQAIFDATGSGIEPAICSIIIGAVQFGSSFCTPLFIDRLGRKILLIISAIGMLISEVALGVYFYLQDDNQDVSSISWLPVLSLVCFIITYNIGFGPIPWAIMGEVFPSNVKSIASSLTSGFSWLLAFLITKFFQQMSDAIGMGQSFWIFAAFCFLAVLFLYFYVIETKGKSFQEIQDALES